ncbi:MAG: 50S ribosomal protein L4 [Proteobacteria bacterium]|nr:50S ribosomal protein L4 [Pseudomonadota bacterium]NLN61621.1 50S ribosomal protein L4 [Myxococcales bacterium]
MPKVQVKDLKNNEVGTMELSDEIFGAEVKYHLLHEIVRMQRNKKRAGNACTKERNAVAGGGRKPYKQKGTGRARQGSLRAPNHVGGGVVFGPKPRSFAFLPPKKVRRGAMKSALSLFVKEQRLLILDSFELSEIKTKALLSSLHTIGASKAVLVDFDENLNLKLSAGNLKDHLFLPPEGLNVYDLLKHDQLVISRRAVEQIETHLLRPIRERKVD